MGFTLEGGLQIEAGNGPQAEVEEPGMSEVPVAPEEGALVETSGDVMMDQIVVENFGPEGIRR